MAHIDRNAGYYKDPYAIEFEAQVISCTPLKEGYGVILSDTLFYPEGGGQPCDLGTLNDKEVLHVSQKDNGIVHRMKEPIEEGTKVHGKIDWGRRFQFMQDHSGEHIVSGLIHQNFGYENVGFHIGECIQIDFDGPLTRKQAEEIEYRANEVIMKNKEIHELYPSKEELAAMSYRSKKELEGEVRIIEIPDTDRCACCGTHVRYTGEVGVIKFLGFEKHKEGVRIRMLCGKEAFRYIQSVYAQNENVSHLLSAPMEGTAEAVEKLLEEKGTLLRRVSALEDVLYEKKAEEIEEQAFVVLYEDSNDGNRMRKFADDLVRSGKVKTAAILFGKPEQPNYLIRSDSLPLSKIAKEFNAGIHGKGGGKDDLVRGSCGVNQETAKEALKELLGKY